MHPELLAGRMDTADELDQLLLVPFQVVDPVPIAIMTDTIDENLDSTKAEPIVAESRFETHRQQSIEVDLVADLRIHPEADRQLVEVLQILNGQHVVFGIWQVVDG